MSSDEDIQAAAEVWIDLGGGGGRTVGREIAAAVVAAVRPLIEARALNDAADEIDARTPRHLWENRAADWLRARAVGVGGQHTDTPPAGIDIRKVAESPPPPDFDWAALNAIDGRDVGAGTPEATDE